jgi:hypothetical protein
MSARFVRYRLVLCTVLMAIVGAALANAAIAGSVTMNVQPNYVEFTNNQATWRIYTHCADGVGPGYVAQVRMKVTNRVLLDDTNAGTQDYGGIPRGSDPHNIRVPLGLGKFIFRDARATQGTALSYTGNILSSGGNTFVMDERHCAGDPWGSQSNPNPPSQDPGVNGSLSGPINGTPSYDSINDVGSVDVVTVFQDSQSSDILRVLHRWKVYPNYIKMWADVIEDCSSGTCPNAWIKGPKFVAGLNGTPDGVKFSQVTTYNSTGTGVCAADYGAPDTNAGPCPVGTGADGRARAQYNYVSPTHSPAAAGDSPNCSSSQRCFNSIFRAYSPSNRNIIPGGTARNWYGDALSLDGWAYSAQFYSTEGTAGSGNCTFQTSTGAADSRKWEAPGDKTDTNGDGLINYADLYSFVAGYFFGWRDCTNVADDPKIFVSYDGVDYGTYASFSFNDGVTNYFSQTMNG